MAANDDFGELLIEALEEAVAYKTGERPGLRVTRYEVTARRATLLESIAKPEPASRRKRKTG